MSAGGSENRWALTDAWTGVRHRGGRGFCEEEQEYLAELQEDKEEREFNEHAEIEQLIEAHERE